MLTFQATVRIYPVYPVAKPTDPETTLQVSGLALPVLLDDFLSAAKWATTR